MPVKRKWKLIGTSTILIISLSLLLIPYNIINDDWSFHDLYGVIGIPKGDEYKGWYSLPLISHSQSFYISLNLSEGLESIFVFTSHQYYEYDWEHSTNASYQIRNVTEFEGTIYIDPPIQNMIHLVIYGENESLIKPTIIFRYLTYYTNYGIFFSSIFVVLLIYYINQIIKKRF